VILDFFNIGITFACRQSYVTSPFLKDILKMKI